ncbi:MAG TPA: alpha/beta hydrolase [Acidimicrobiales bacterium]|nr:alpha/beta hydrolase [Acidimicrobiales bacterium]
MDLYVERRGEGRPFVWAHGLTSCIAQEDEVGLFDWGSIPGIALTRYDAPGHGRSPAPLDDAVYEWRNLASVMLEVMAASATVAGGASMGCATAIYAALAAPERVTGLVLVIPPTAWATRAAQTDLYLKGADYVAANGTAAYIERLREMPAQPPWSAPTREIGWRHTLAMDPVALPHVLRGAARSDLPGDEDLATIAAPAIVLAWADDPGHPVSTAEHLVEVLPAASLHVARSRDEVLAWPRLVESFVASLDG